MYIRKNIISIAMKLHMPRYRTEAMDTGGSVNNVDEASVTAEDAAPVLANNSKAPGADVATCSRTVTASRNNVVGKRRYGWGEGGGSTEDAGEAHRVKSPHAAQQTYRRLGFARDLEVLVLNCDDPHLRHFGVTELERVERNGDRGCGVEGRGSSGSSLPRAGE